MFDYYRYALIAALVCAGLVGCDTKGKVEGRSVQVQVFITTRDGQSIRLGNVPVLFVRDDDFAEKVQAINRLASSNAEGCKVKIQADLDVIRKAQALPMGTATAGYSQAKQFLRQDYAEYNDLRFLLHDMMIRTYSESSHPETRRCLVYTDADGTASLALPNKHHAYYIMAASERTVGSTREKYCWLELVQPATTTLQLSNNNLWDANAQGTSVGFQLPPDLPAYPELLN